MKNLLIRLIRGYQTWLSPLKRRPCCRFYPSCSQYALEALTEWGVIKGSALSLRRILRCNPFCKGGIDYVPRRHKESPKIVSKEQKEQ